MRASSSTRSGRRTSCARTPSSAPRRIRPMSPNNASATISRRAASAPASMRMSMPATSPRRGAAAGALAAVGRARHHRQRHRRRGLLPGALSRSIRAAAQRSDAGAQRVRGSGAVREPGADLLPHHDARGRDRRAIDRRGREGPDVPRRRQPRSAALGQSRQLRHHAQHQRPCRLWLRHPYVRRPARRAAGRRDHAGGAGAQGRDHRDHRARSKRRYNNTLRGLESLPVTIRQPDEHVRRADLVQRRPDK